MKAILMILLAGLSFLYYPNFTLASEPGYPTKPIEVIVGYSPGGGVDLSMRVLAEHAKKFLKQDIIILNRPGGGGRVAMPLVAKSKPDGYTLGAVTDSTFILLPHLEPVAYKPLEDFTLITQYGNIDFGIMVPPDSPFKSFKELIEFARANPNKLSVGTAGVGTTPHVACEALCRMEGLKINIVPFSGGGPAMAAFLGGHFMVFWDSSPQIGRLVKEKKARLLCVMTEERIAGYPDVPTLKELGYPLVFQSWYIIFGPKNMDRAIVNKLAEDFKKAMKHPDFIKILKDLESWKENPLSGNELKEGIIRRYKANEELFTKLGMAVKQ